MHSFNSIIAYLLEQLEKTHLEVEQTGVPPAQGHHIPSSGLQTCFRLEERMLLCEAIAVGLFGMREPRGKVRTLPKMMAWGGGLSRVTASGPNLNYWSDFAGVFSPCKPHCSDQSCKRGKVRLEEITLVWCFLADVQINIKRCLSDGCDTRIHGLRAIGYQRVRKGGVSVCDASAIWYWSLLTSLVTASMETNPAIVHTILQNTQWVLFLLLCLSPLVFHFYVKTSVLACSWVIYLELMSTWATVWASGWSAQASA